MNKYIKNISLVLLSIALSIPMLTMNRNVLTTFAYDNVTSGDAIAASTYDVEIIGKIDSTIISVIMPTRIQFAVIPEVDNWNKVLSPDFSIRNIGNAMINVSITKAEMITENVSFTSTNPIVQNGTRQVRMAIAPKDSYSNINMLNNYFLLDSISDNNSILLSSSLDYNSKDDTATYNIYGDISSGWENGEEFAVNAVFKVAAK